MKHTCTPFHTCLFSEVHTAKTAETKLPRLPVSSSSEQWVSRFLSSIRPYPDSGSPAPPSVNLGRELNMTHRSKDGRAQHFTACCCYTTPVSTADGFHTNPAVNFAFAVYLLPTSVTCKMANRSHANPAAYFSINVCFPPPPSQVCAMMENRAHAILEGIFTPATRFPSFYLLFGAQKQNVSQLSGRLEPLVVALTGSTGTGKTETAWVLADGLLAKRCRISGGTTDIPRGLLVLK